MEMMFLLNEDSIILFHAPRLNRVSAMLGALYIASVLEEGKIILVAHRYQQISIPWSVTLVPHLVLPTPHWCIYILGDNFRMYSIGTGLFLDSGFAFSGLGQFLQPVAMASQLPV